MIVHGLYHGFALCGFSRDVPGSWPEGHSWLAIDPTTLLEIREPLLASFCRDCLPIAFSMVTVHVTHDGMPICGFEREAGSWPEGHQGIEVTDWTIKPNCVPCLAVLARTYRPKTVYDRIRENADEDAYGVEEDLP